MVQACSLPVDSSAFVTSVKSIRLSAVTVATSQAVESPLLTSWSDHSGNSKLPLTQILLGFLASGSAAKSDRQIRSLKQGLPERLVSRRYGNQLQSKVCTGPMLIGALPNHSLVPTHLPPSLGRLLGPPSSDQSLQTLTRFPLALQKLHFSMESEDPWMRNRGSSWQRCSHAGASFRPSSLNSGSHGCDPYGIVHLNVEIT